MTNYKLLITNLISLILFTAVACAATHNTTGNPGDTASGTTIVAASTFESVTWKDGLGTLIGTAEPSSGNELATAEAEYGLFGPGTLSDVSVTPGETAYHSYNATNEGNADDTYTFKYSYYQFALATDWVAEVWSEGTRVTTLTASSITTEVQVVSEDSDRNFYYKIIVPIDIAKAPNGSYITVVTTIETASTPVVGNPPYNYTGGNYLTYAGRGSNEDSVQDQVAAPILTLSRASTVDATSTYTGGSHDAVPGAVITFTMTYGNDGEASAESVVLVDKIPTNTKLAHVNNSGSITTPTTLTISAAQGSAEGWTIKYSTLDNPDKTYGVGAPTWEAIGTLTTATVKFPSDGTTYIPANDPYNAKWIKWEKQYVDPAEDSQTLTWGVTIR
jgi:uncharacterized repeat protein (TIGR01451 family)